MNKPTYYLLKTDFKTQADFESEKELYSRLGFRVVTFQDGQSDNDIHEGLKAIIKNHIE